MKKFILSTMALALAITAMAQDVNTKYTEAVDAYKVKKYDVAAKAFEQVIDLGGDASSAEAKVTTAKTYLPKCYFSLSLAAARAKNYDSAISNAAKSAELAELYGDMGDMTKAKALIGNLYKAQGGAAFNNKDYAAALTVFEKGYAMDPRNVEMANWLGICYCETGNLEKGMQVFAKVAKMGPTNPTKYGADAEKAKANMSLYINNAVASLQEKKDYDGIIT
ncbi:MAG: tetratricopeptide repeat protein, partial [Rikenellaceae bacterium]